MTFKSLKRLVAKLAPAVLLLTSFTSHATDYSDLPAAYNIEVVIFSFNQTEAAGSEIWPDLVKIASVDQAIELHDFTGYTDLPGPDKMGYYYSKIPPEEYQLNKQVEKLTSSRQVKVIYHSAWIQPGLDKDAAEFIHIRSEETKPGLQVLDPLNTITGNLPANNTANPLFVQPASTEEETPALLDGVVKVELGRYLHIYFDLKYQRNLAPQQGVIDASSQGIKQIKFYPVQMHRRMRSKEVHYIDHPLIGILVLATPFKLPEKDEPEMVNQPLFKLQNIPVKK